NETKPEGQTMTMTTSDTPGIAPYPLAERGNIIIKGRDSDALVIGEAYRKARASVVDSVRYLIEVGRALIRKKESLPHGEWLPGVDANADVVGFSGRSTETRLMQVARKCCVNASFDESKALQINRQVWGNDNVRGTQGTGENEWYTPPEYIAAVRD